MRCWRCGKEIENYTGECVYCHASLQRTIPITAEGAALRQLYDHYGSEEVFGNPTVLVNGFGDVVKDTLVTDVKKIRNNLKAAMDAGISRLYLDQLKIGKPDPDFDARVRKVLTEHADLSEKATYRLMGWFDEMIGWKVPATEPVNAVPRPQMRISPAPNVPMQMMEQQISQGNNPYTQRRMINQQMPSVNNPYIQQQAMQKPQNNKEAKPVIKKMSIILGIVFLVLVLLIAFVIFVDRNGLWCDILPFLWDADVCAHYVR